MVFYFYNPKVPPYVILLAHLPCLYLMIPSFGSYLPVTAIIPYLLQTVPELLSKVNNKVHISSVITHSTWVWLWAATELGTWSCDSVSVSDGWWTVTCGWTRLFPFLLLSYESWLWFFPPSCKPKPKPKPKPPPSPQVVIRHTPSLIHYCWSSIITRYSRIEKWPPYVYV